MNTARPRHKLSRKIPLPALLTTLITMSAMLISSLPQPAAAAVGNDDYTAPGNYQTQAGCEGNWDPGCQATVLAKQETGLYTLEVDLPAGEWQFKITQGGTWDRNWGVDGQAGGDNLTYHSDGGKATLYFDPHSKRAAIIKDSQTVVVAGSFQKALGCEGDWQPACRMPLLFPAADGTYTWTTENLPAGNYEAKIAIGGTWDTNYGVGGDAGGANYQVSIGNGPVTFTYHPDTHVLDVVSDAVVVQGLGQQRALWIDATTIAWPKDLLSGTDLAASNVELVTSETGEAKLEDGKVTGGQRHSLAVGGPLPEETLQRYPHLAGMVSLQLPADTDPATVKQWLKGQHMVAVTSGGETLAYTGLQVAPVLDSLYAAAAQTPLGITWEEGSATARLWAPTATEVSLEVNTDTGSATYPAQLDENTGVWTKVAPANVDWNGARYRWKVTVWVPSSGLSVTNSVTDPYAKALTTDSTWAVMVDLNDPRWQPEKWLQTPAPKVRNDAARNIYELHIRDFSIKDESVPADQRGTYLAFTHPESNGMRHLKALAQAGMNTIHLLPSFDIATIPENRDDQVDPLIPPAGADSDQQQAAVSAVAEQDGFNWGYDPYHFQAPEGSYATAQGQDGAERVAQFRSMVAGLHGAGYQVVLDQVYNHAAASGQDDKSVLDKIVPGYYHRLSLNGTVENSTCCANLATENTMMEKLMVDSLVTWAREYRVDGFRFDLMGHSSRANLEAARTALDALTLETDGVDGKSIYLYGEGWDFGEVAGNARFYQAKQGQLDGTGIGAFNDRLRDAVHGGGPFDEFAREFQGFGNGLFTDPNGFSELTGPQQQAQLEHLSDLVRLGMAGNLKDFKFTTSAGKVQRGDEIKYGDQPAGFASQPAENVNYVDAHDNETLYDLNVMKMPTNCSMEERIRMNTVSLATVTWGQSPVFWHAGTDILRSKSLDRDSYNSGDHFNAIDWTLETNGFGNGLPVEGKNGDKWHWMGPLLANENLKPATADMQRANAMARELLQVRTSSPLFSLGSAELIGERVTFPASGEGAVPGLIVMHIEDGGGSGVDVDEQIDGALVAINATPLAASAKLGELAGRDYRVNAVQAGGVDAETMKEVSWEASSGELSVPARTAVVLFAAAKDDEPVVPVEPIAPPNVEPNDPPSVPGDSGTDLVPHPTQASAQAAALSKTGTNAGILGVSAVVLLMAGTALILLRGRR
ncbi:MAG: pullulanase-type alpha-1,6-glucosidase [Actinomycetaceae bacterium]|nr:pullulanase-type alpha-1,6-glucosidase [Actinomycetaceae bacterium]